jgi:putative chitinase
MTKDQFLSFYKAKPNEHDASVCYDYLHDALMKNNMLTDNMLVALLATVRVECGSSFKPVKEIITPELAEKNYQHNSWLGNTEAGDGYKFRGRGWSQLTGRWNYTDMSKKIGVDLVNNPDLLLQPENSAKVMVQFAKDKNIAVAIARDNFARVRKLWNGGNGVDVLKGGTTHGLDEFLRVVNQYLLVK